MTVVLDLKAPLAAEAAFLRLGFSVLRLPPNPRLPLPVSSHPDMLVFFAPDEILCTKTYAEIAKKELDALCRAADRPMRVVEQECGDAYPYDILFNCATVGTHRFCLPAFTAHEILTDSRFSVRPVKQGYTKCSTLPVGKQALITEDPSIERAALSAGLDVMMIPAGEVKLDGYEHGFLGGASSFAPYGIDQKIYFCGSLKAHSMGDEIRDFCRSHGFEPISLFDGPLTDVGTMFLIKGD